MTGVQTCALPIYLTAFFVTSVTEHAGDANVTVEPVDAASWLLTVTGEIPAEGAVVSILVDWSSTGDVENPDQPDTPDKPIVKPGGGTLVGPSRLARAGSGWGFQLSVLKGYQPDTATFVKGGDFTILVNDVRNTGEADAEDPDYIIWFIPIEPGANFNASKAALF